MSALRPLLPLLLAAGILLGGNGIQSMLIPMRASAEGFSATNVGLIGTFYFAGFLIGCLTVQSMLRAVGHVRTFAALAAIAAASALTLVLAIDPYVWMGLRLITGFAFAGLFTVMEAWLNAGVGNTHRARLLAIYRVVDISSASAFPYLIPVFGAMSFAIFAIASMMITLSLVPLSLGDRSNPAAPEDVKLDLKRAWMISPVGVFGALAAGLANGAVRSMGPLYASDIGLSEAATVTFLSLGIVGGGIVQFPLGWLSDRWDRRGAILLVGALAAVFALALAFWHGTEYWLFLLVFLYGCAAMPIYPLASAHANDRAQAGEFVLLSAALMLFWAIGAVGGPLFAAAVMQSFGAPSLFVYVAVIHMLFVAVTLWRLGAREAAPAEQRGEFTPFAGNPPRGLAGEDAEPR